MRFLSNLFGKQCKSFPLGLADPGHPARKWIDAASVIADRRMDVKLVNGKPAIETNSGILLDFVGALDMAILEASEDPDLLATRASAHYLLHETAKANQDIERALRIQPRHVEASALRRYGDKWNNLLFMPSWSENSRTIHSVLADKANQGDSLHCIRHSLQAALVLLLIGTRQEFPDVPTRCRWQVVCSETPYGPIGAHYVVLDIHGDIRRQEFILAPSTHSNDVSAPPPVLLTRLSCMRTCFIVVADSSGEVLFNMQYNLPLNVRKTLKNLSRKLSATTGSDSSVIRMAAEWHMQHFELDSVVFPA